jgi:phage shock protein C
MYCNACGKALSDDARFCTFCGIGVGAGHPPVRKKLMRSRADRKVAGICAGLADYLDLDVILVRLIWAVATIASGILPGIVAYVLAWIIVPEVPELWPMVATGQPVTNQ